ncbi:MAG: hypothetical protein MZV70_64300 [Desulfobacterales bacterium]|nr:hypothetical protein [Desulfobacterales bacterium]
MVAIRVVDDEDDVMLMTNIGKVIRTRDPGDFGHQPQHPGGEAHRASTWASAWWAPRAWARKDEDDTPPTRRRTDAG